MKTPLGNEIDKLNEEIIVLQNENGTLKIELMDVLEKHYKEEERHETELIQAFASGAVVTFLLIVVVFLITYLVG